MKLDAFKLKARSLSADARRRLGPLAELAKDLGGEMSVRCSRNLFESEDDVEIKFVLDVKVSVGDEDVLDARLEIHANRTRRERDSIVGEIASVEVSKNHRRKGLARTTLKCLEGMWSDLGVTEVRTVGIGDGRVVWARQVFGNDFENPEYVRNLYERWCDNTRSPLRRIGLKPYRYPRKFLLSLSSVEYVKRIDHADTT